MIPPPLLDAVAQPSGTIAPLDFAEIADLVRSRSGIVLGPDKAYLVESRLDPVLRRHGLSSLCELSARLRRRSDDALSADVIDAMTTNETLFFRDSWPFDHLRTSVLPRLQAAQTGPQTSSQPIRIWSAASSSGQEAYSTAITALATPGRRPVHILGTDISSVQVERARRGVYSDFEVSRGLGADVLARHFTRGVGTWEVNEPLRRLVEFRVWNLLGSADALGSFDVVFCRNVLIYFDVETKRRVLDTIWRRMLPGGTLYLGGAETLFGVSDRFTAVPDAVKAYQPVRP